MTPSPPDRDGWVLAYLHSTQCLQLKLNPSLGVPVGSEGSMQKDWPVQEWATQKCHKFGELF